MTILYSSADWGLWRNTKVTPLFSTFYLNPCYILAVSMCKSSLLTIAATAGFVSCLRGAWRESFRSFFLFILRLVHRLVRYGWKTVLPTYQHCTNHTINTKLSYFTQSYRMTIYDITFSFSPCASLLFFWQMKALGSYCWYRIILTNTKNYKKHNCTLQCTSIMGVKMCRSIVVITNF